MALKKNGCRYDAENLQSGLDKIESYYLEDGWYRDGASGQKDYYISFAMHYYGLLYSVAMADEDPERCARFRERAGIFARDFIYWFDEDGAALPYGRSLSYRFGEAAFWSAYVFAGLDEIPVAVVKGILARHLNWWCGQKIFDRDGVLTIGCENTEENDAARGAYVYNERRSGNVQRSFTLTQIDEDAITAEYKDGVLRLILPKIHEEGKTNRRIEIQ